MDNLTHSLTGLFLSRSGLNRLTPHASAIVVLAANIPDIDVVSGLFGSGAYLTWHRHFTHALAFVPLMALLPVLIVKLAARLMKKKPVPWRGAYLASLGGALSHPLLDWTNLYGVRLLLPFRDDWQRLDITSVVDLWIWGVLALCVAFPALAKLVGGEIGATRRSPYPPRGFAIFALLFLLVYNGGRAVLHARAVAVLDAHMYQGASAKRVAALPHALNPFSWRALIETDTAWIVHEVNLLTEFEPLEGQAFTKPEASPAMARARQVPAVRDFTGFAQFPLWRTMPYPEPEGATRVEVVDLRFGDPSAPGFQAGCVLDARLNPVQEWVNFGRARPR